ncbi:RNA polymerase sigma-70 factor, ECF subfamily [Lachnospiraceae bacterium]|nr:RNA polymerase sigma-70 factor, ECF subfamily [Lachnospiraceae bacterium]
MQMARKQVRFIETCYKLYEQKMYYVAYSILHDEGKAEDAVQDAFLKLMKHEVQFERADSDDCKRYIITVIRNAAITIYNKTKKESEYMYLTDKDERAEAAVDMDLDSDTDWKSLIETLPEKYREVVECLVIKEYTTRETATKLNITEANVRKRYERAKQMMKDYVTEKGIYVEQSVYCQ